MHIGQPLTVLLLLGALTNASAYVFKDGRLDCTDLPNPNHSLTCMIQHGDCVTPSWLTGADRAYCYNERTRARKELEAALSPADKRRPQSAEKAYNTFVKAQCEFETGMEAGRALEGDIAACYAEKEALYAEDYQRMQSQIISRNNKRR